MDTCIYYDIAKWNNYLQTKFHPACYAIKSSPMEDYILYTGSIEGHKEIRIYPLQAVSDVYLIHWDGYELGTIRKIDNKWFTSTPELLGVANEIGAFIDSRQR